MIVDILLVACEVHAILVVMMMTPNRASGM